MDKELLACPFCRQSVQRRDALWVSDGCTDAIIHAAPTDCGLVEFSIGTADHGKSVSAAWNRRASPAHMDKVREALERILAANERYCEANQFAREEPDPITTACDEAKALLASLDASPAQAEGGWRPIETAPKDGTHVLVAFRPYEQWTTFMQKPATVAHWFGPPDLPGLRAGGWYLSVQQNEGPRIRPTHWQPLPPPPAASIRSGREG